MKVLRTDKHILKFSKELDTLYFNSKNLYNYCNYILRQSFIQTSKLPSEYDLSKQLTKEKQEDWVKLKANTNQQVLKLLYKNWKSFFKAIKECTASSSKFLGRPKLPKYKHKTKGRNAVIFPCNNKTNIRNGYFYFPKFTSLSPIKTKVTNETLNQARIIPQQSCFILEIIYTLEVPDIVEGNNYLSIDLGIDNFATCFNGSDNTSFIIDGKALKSFNQYYNKKKANLQSTLKMLNNSYTSKRLNRLELKRKNKIVDFMHRASKYVVSYCLNRNIQNIVVGHNKNWKQQSNIGKANNQRFVQIPFSVFIEQLRYKCENVGINFIITEESYTSKIDHLAFEEMLHHDSYLGKRIYRGLFKSSTGKYINADVNGAIGILRKVIDEDEFYRLINRGIVNTPYKVNLLKTAV